VYRARPGSRPCLIKRRQCLSPTGAHSDRRRYQVARAPLPSPLADRRRIKRPAAERPRSDYAAPTPAPAPHPAATITAGDRQPMRQPSPRPARLAALPDKAPAMPQPDRRPQRPAIAQGLREPLPAAAPRNIGATRGGQPLHHTAEASHRHRGSIAPTPHQRGKLHSASEADSSMEARRRSLLASHAKRVNRSRNRNVTPSHTRTWKKENVANAACGLTNVSRYSGMTILARRDTSLLGA
jgi:hypothetical protein